LASAARLIFRRPEISRAADDSGVAAVYRGAVRLRPARLRVDPVRLDYAVAAVLTVVAQVEIWLGNEVHSHRLWGALIVNVATLSVALRRRYPALVGTLVPVFDASQHALKRDPQIVAGAIGYFCALYALAVWAPPRPFRAGLALIVAADFASSAGPGGNVKNAVPFTVVTVAVTLLVRRVIGDREQRAELAERERDVAAREAVVEERARIARELHDVIAHNVSMMVVQAGAERRVVQEGTTREVLETVEQIGRSALTEMRRLVGMLRSEVDNSLAPQPGLDDLATLAKQVREAGLPVELRVEGERRDLPAGIELSAYRIVQEALTNALKHAGDARAEVHVRYGPDSLELEIVDDGTTPPASVSGGGHGLVGMRERVALYGGRLDAGRRASGGFAVRVLLPIR
jgi:signal transduction histidine kinase